MYKIFLAIAMIIHFSQAHVPISDHQ